MKLPLDGLDGPARVLGGELEELGGGIGVEGAGASAVAARFVFERVQAVFAVAPEPAKKGLGGKKDGRAVGTVLDLGGELARQFG